MTIQLEPELAGTYFNLGIVKSELDNKEGALADFRIFLKKTEEEPDDWYKSTRKWLFENYPKLQEEFKK